MDVSQLLVEPRTTGSFLGGHVFRRAAALILVLLVGFFVGLVVASLSAPEADQLPMETAPPHAANSSQAVVVTTQPDGTPSCSNLTKSPGGGDLVVYQWKTGRLDAIRCNSSSAGGTIGLGSAIQGN